MAGAKDFTTFKEQVDILENEKGIIIPDHQDAEEILQHIGYFSLMGGYKRFCGSGNGQAASRTLSR